MDVEVITTGNEILSGLTLDTNFRWLAERLTERSFNVRYHTSVTDHAGDIIAALGGASAHAGAVIVSGGLGPTDDDLTSRCAAEFFGVPLETDPRALASIEERLRGLGREMKDAHRGQAMMPRGARFFANLWGTAPGYMYEHGGALFFFLPGVPGELQGMFERSVMPELERHAGTRARSVTKLVRTTGLKESEVAERLDGLTMDGVYLGYRVHDPEVHLRVTGSAPTGEEAEALALEFTGLLRERLGAYVFSTGGESLPEVVGGMLAARGMTLAIAESCTGGLVASRITDVPGSSGWFERGLVTYSNEAKVEMLGVPRGLIEELGAVSGPVAERMAEGARTVAGTDLGVGISGIAGPGGGTALKPVGTVFIALAQGAGPPTSHAFLFHGTRRQIKYTASQRALEIIRQYFLDTV